MFQNDDSRKALAEFPKASPDLAMILWELKRKGGSGSIVELEGVAQRLTRFPLSSILAALADVTPWGAERIDTSRIWVLIRQLKKIGESTPDGVASIAPLLARWALHDDPGDCNTRSRFSTLSEYERHTGKYGAAILLKWVRGLTASDAQRASCVAVYFANIAAPHLGESLRQLLEIVSDAANPFPAEAAGIILEGQKSLPANDAQLLAETRLAMVLTQDQSPRVRLSAVRCAGKLTSPPKADDTLFTAVESTISTPGDFCVRLEAFSLRASWNNEWKAEWATNMVDAALHSGSYKSPEGQSMDPQSWLAQSLAKLATPAVPALVYGAERERAMSGWPGHFLGALNGLVERKSHSGQPEDVRKACCSAVSEHAATIAKLVEDAKGHNGYRTRTALKIIGSVGGTDSLAARIRGDKEAPEKFGVSGLYWTYRHNPEARPAILALLNDDDQAVRRSALLAVSAIRVWSDAEYVAVQALFSSEDLSISALAAAAYVTHTGPEMSAAFVHLAQLCEFGFRDHALRAIKEAGWVDDPKPQTKVALRFARCDAGLGDWAGLDTE